MSAGSPQGHQLGHPPAAESIRLLAEGKIDALVGFPPVPQELRAQKIGHVVVNSAVDRPWSQYFCCMVRQPGVRPQAPGRHQARAARHPESDRHLRPRAGPGRAPSRRQGLHAALRLRAADDAGNPLRQVARVRSRGHGALLCAAPARGRHDQATPQKIIAQGTDWRFLNELKKELKA